MTENNSIFIDIVKELGGLLLDVDKPGRYVGGEFGRLANIKYQTLISKVS